MNSSHGWVILRSASFDLARRASRLLVAACVLIAAGYLLLAPDAAFARYLPQERVPVSSPVYRDLERLMETYRRVPLPLSTRPLRLREITAFLDAIGADYPEAAQDPSWIRARRLVARDAPGARGPFLTIHGDSTETVEISPYASVVYEDDPKNRPDINRDYRIGAQVAAAIDSSAIFVFDGYEGTASQGGRGTPNFGRLNSVIEGVDLNSWMEEAYAELQLSRVRLMIGHQSMRWGPGRDGTLALSEAAPPLDMLRLEAGFARKWRGQSFVALLDPGPQTYLAGHRVEWSFLPNWHLGVNELARFDGTSQALLYMIPVVPYSFWEKRPKSEPAGSVPGDTTGLALSKNNVLLSVDLAWYARPGYRIWGEFLVDDISFSSDYKPDMIGWQAGVEERWVLGGPHSGMAHTTSGGSAADTSGQGGMGGMAMSGGAPASGAGGTPPTAAGGAPASGALRPQRAISVSLEYNRVNNYVYSAWHGHDFSFEGFPIGFVYGPDVMQVAVEAGYEHSASWELRLRAELRRKGEGSLGNPWRREDGKVDAGAISGIVERDARVAARLSYTPSRMLRLDATVGYASFKNEDHRNIGVENELPFRLAARVEW